MRNHMVLKCLLDQGGVGSDARLVHMVSKKAIGMIRTQLDHVAEEYTS